MANLPLRLLADAIRNIALRAGQEILSIYESDFAVRRKADRSPVTVADEVAERLILSELARLDPDLQVLAEESFAHGVAPDVGERPFWAVDPLDGTKEFIRRNGEFTVNIGLVADRAPVAGVVYAPALRVLYLAAGAGTAVVETGGAAPHPIAARVPEADGLVVVASRSHDGPRTDAYLKTVLVRRTRVMGSSLKFCLVAAGKADLYPRIGPTNEWDTAAGHAVVIAAGGSVRTVAGAELRYGKPGFRNGPFIVRGREARTDSPCPPDRT